MAASLLAEMSAMSAFLQRAIAGPPSAGKTPFVVLFQRGAMGGLNVVVPFAEPNYYQLRPSIPSRSPAVARAPPRSI
jgi:uncharacterized protein (DUF1501 family)